MSAETTAPTLPLEPLTRRLSECPPEFLLPPIHTADGKIDTNALIQDTLRLHRVYPGPAADFNALLYPDPHKPNRLKLAAITCWLLNDPSVHQCLRGNKQLALGVYPLLTSKLHDLAQVVKAEDAVNDPDRREELVRRCLAGLGILPEGETPAQASDRLATLDSIERTKVISQTRDAEARAKELRKKMAEEAARAAAARYTSE